ARERDEAAVVRYRGVVAVLVSLSPARIDADALGRLVLPVANEDVDVSVRVSRYEVSGEAGEKDESTIGCHRSAEDQVVRQSPVPADAQPFRRSEDPVADEGVRTSVRGSREEVVGRAAEPDESAVGRDLSPP